MMYTPPLPGIVGSQNGVSSGVSHVRDYVDNQAAIREYYVPMWHCNDVIMGAIASQITSLNTVYSTVYSDAPRHRRTYIITL